MRGAGSQLIVPSPRSPARHHPSRATRLNEPLRNAPIGPDSQPPPFPQPAAPSPGYLSGPSGNFLHLRELTVTNLALGRLRDTPSPFSRF